MKLLAFLSILLLPINLNALSAWDQYNNPDILNIDYVRNFSQLPLAAELAKRPWNGNYWPTHRGGITYRWNQPYPEERDESNPRYHFELIRYLDLVKQNIKDLSPAEKYDLFLGRDDFPLTTFEKNRTNISKTNPLSEDFDEEFKIPTWEGLCHAWAPAAYLFDEPGAVTVKGHNGEKIEFGASDIKALLIYFLHINRDPSETKTRFLGTRCYLDFKKYEEKLEEGEITKEEFEAAINSSKCSDTNAGAFHVLLTNQIGILEESFVADVIRDAEVWNYPIYWYESKITEEKEGASEGAAEGTVKEVSMVTLIKHAYSITQSWYPNRRDNEWDRYLDEVNGIERFEYTVELDDRGNIIGGEWISDNRPDFVWIQKLPDFKGFFAPLKGIYQKSLEALEKANKFWKVVKAGDLNELEDLLSEVDINMPNSEGNSALHIAIKSENIELVKFLIKKGIKVNSQNLLGQSPLHYAALKGNLEMVQLLLKNKADKTLVDDYNYKAEDYAASFPEVVALLED